MPRTTRTPVRNGDTPAPVWVVNEYSELKESRCAATDASPPTAVSSLRHPRVSIVACDCLRKYDH